MAPVEVYTSIKWDSLCRKRLLKRDLKKSHGIYTYTSEPGKHTASLRLKIYCLQYLSTFFWYFFLEILVQYNTVPIFTYQLRSESP